MRADACARVCVRALGCCCDALSTGYIYHALNVVANHYQYIIANANDVQGGGATATHSHDGGGVKRECING